MTRKAPAFMFYANDFLSAVLGWNATEIGAYIQLLCFQVDRGSVGEREIRYVAGTCDQETVDFVIESKFDKQTDGTFTNARMVSVLKEYEDYRKKQIENGRKGGLSKAKNKRSASDAKAKHLANGLAKSKRRSSQTPSEPPSENLASTSTSTSTSISTSNTKSISKRERVIPSLEEVKAYAEQRKAAGHHVCDPVKFFEYFEAGDWHDRDNKPVKRWKQKFIVWSDRNPAPVNGRKSDGGLDFDKMFDERFGGDAQ